MDKVLEIDRNCRSIIREIVCYSHEFASYELVMSVLLSRYCLSMESFQSLVDVSLLPSLARLKELNEKVPCHIICI